MRNLFDPELQVDQGAQQGSCRGAGLKIMNIEIGTRDRRWIVYLCILLSLVPPSLACQAYLDTFGCDTNNLITAYPEGLVFQACLHDNTFIQEGLDRSYRYFQSSPYRQAALVCSNP